MSFKTQFIIEFFLPFTGCRKVLGKMPDIPMLAIKTIFDVMACHLFYT